MTRTRDELAELLLRPYPERLEIEHQDGMHKRARHADCNGCFPDGPTPHATAAPPPQAEPLPPAPPKFAPHRFVPAIEHVAGQRVCAACGEPRATHPRLAIAPGGLAEVFAELRRSLRVDQPDPPAEIPVMADGGPYCERCRGTRWLRRDVDVTDPEFGRSMACPDCARGFLLQKRLDKLFGSLPELFRDWTLETFPTGHPFQAQALGRIREWMEDPSKPWLYLHGAVGRGKTGLAVGILHEATTRGRSGLFKVVPDILGRIRHTYRSRDAYDADEADLLDALYEAELLVLDDLGSENATDWASEKLFQIIGTRHDQRRQTVITSNLSLPALGEHLGHPRTASRIAEMARGYILDLSQLPSLRLRAMSA